MINALSKRVTGFFIRSSIIAEEDKENYVFCFEVMFFDLLSLITVLVMAVIFGRFIITVIYLLTFSLLRFNAGGFHAKTHLRCYLTLCLTSLLFILLILVIPEGYYTGICVSSTLFSAAIIIKFAPIQHVNRPLSGDEERRSRIKSRIMTLLLSAVILVGVFLVKAKYDVLFLAGSLGMSAIALSMTAVKISHLLRRLGHVKSQND